MKKLEGVDHIFKLINRNSNEIYIVFNWNNQIQGESSLKKKI